ncbi:hypothetical protein IHQ71_08755 [Rhizobium sp. TH2]|uniref:hypothetical protein n=1 Tax=Rhizobium sp. TH2 TaxID=2775403 RepID=UPI0021570251|nr:hypothetical protein [Rhizobium sp. TH2]UVC10656.1 hypothetical protein IHQ71_08755 [Rhizobium sp. TH2]
MNRLVIIPILLAGLLLSACQREPEDYITIKGKVFIFNIRVARAFYMLTLNRLPTTPDDAVVVAEFEDPSGGPPLIKKQKVFPKMTRIDLQSPDVNCVVTGKAYKIKITLKSADGEELQTIDTTLNSTLDETMLPEKALVLGAKYDRNPEAFNPDGSIKFRKKCG